jgi:DNA-binding CsgD family transcriptional regulator/predicted negative regulator of RcsB-dependent stress response
VPALPRGRKSITAPTLLERERELALIDDALDAAAAGRARTLLFEGEAGIGKTALLEQLADDARRRGFRTFTARAGALESSLGFGVVRQLFESNVARAAAAKRRSLLSGSAALAAPVLGLGLPAHEGMLPAVSEEIRFQHGLYWLVANMCEHGPVALTVDDAHWCDEPTFAWLLYLLRRSESLPLATAIAVRSGEPGFPRELIAAIAAEAPDPSVQVTPLRLDGTRALIERGYGTAIDADFAAACHDWTGGNPMFVAEVSAELANEGIEPVAASVPRVRQLKPASIARVTLLRFARLPAHAVSLSRALAVLGAAGQLRYAGALAGLTSDAAVAAADVLISARIVEPGETLRFGHPLVAGVVYDDIAPTRRAEEHKRAARLLADGGAADEHVVAQLLRSTPSADDWVTAALLAGAERELASGSAQTALTQLRRVRDEPPPRTLLARVLLLLGLAESLAGDPAAVGSLEAALAASRDPAWRAEVALLLGRVLLRAGRTREALAALEPAIEQLDSTQLDLRLQLEATLITAARFDASLVEYAATRIDRLVTESDKADGAADSHGARLITAQLSWGATAGGASAAVSAELARAALGGGRLVEESVITPDAYLLPILMLSYCDELEDADAHCARALALAQRAGSAPAYAGTACFRSGIAHRRGRLGEAELLARDALRLAEGAPDFALVNGLARAYLANILVDRDAAGEALDVLGDTSRLGESPLVWATELLFAAARARLAQGESSEALDLLLDCGRRCIEWRVKNPAWLPWRSQAALTLHRLGNEDRALELSDEELWRARRFGARGPEGVALRACGLIAGGAGGLDLLRESEATLRESPSRLEYARTLVALGAALRRANQRAEAREPLSLGLDLAEACEAPGLAGEARAELLACGARPRSVVRRGVDELTPSERRVCEMAARGMSNPEIAQALFVTRATVESHLHSAYGKLNLKSRKELVGRLAESNFNDPH